MGYQQLQLKMCLFEAQWMWGYELVYTGMGADVGLGVLNVKWISFHRCSLAEKSCTSTNQWYESPSGQVRAYWCAH